MNENLEIRNYGNNTKAKGVTMLTDSILKTTRSALGVGEAPTAFDSELVLHINAALSILNQNGCGKIVNVQDEAATWGDMQDPLQTVGNAFFHLVPTYVFTKTKILFDPPPPSNVAFYDNYTQELLWRIRIAYEEPQIL